MKLPSIHIFSSGVFLQRLSLRATAVWASVSSDDLKWRTLSCGPHSGVAYKKNTASCGGKKDVQKFGNWFDKMKGHSLWRTCWTDGVLCRSYSGFQADFTSLAVMQQSSPSIPPITPSQTPLLHLHTFPYTIYTYVYMLTLWRPIKHRQCIPVHWGITVDYLLCALYGLHVFFFPSGCAFVASERQFLLLSLSFHVDSWSAVSYICNIWSWIDVFAIHDIQSRSLVIGMETEVKIGQRTSISEDSLICMYDGLRCYYNEIACCYAV